MSEKSPKSKLIKSATQLHHVLNETISEIELSLNTNDKISTREEANSFPFLVAFKELDETISNFQLYKKSSNFDELHKLLTKMLTQKMHLCYITFQQNDLPYLPDDTKIELLAGLTDFQAACSSYKQHSPGNVRIALETITECGHEMVAQLEQRL